ncbi:MAG: mitofilin family membrane protein [Paracoccaceae bacterium]
MPDSDQEDASLGAADENTDAPVVIEGEAEDITDEIVEAAKDDDASIEEDEVVADDTVLDEESTQADALDSEVVPAAAPQVVEEKASTMMPMIFGGLVAGAIGYGASHFGAFDQTSETEVAASAVDTSAFETQLSELSTELGALSEAQSGLAGDIAGITATDTAPLTARLDTLTADLEALQEMPVPSADLSSDVITRIEALESQESNVAVDTTVSDALATRLDTLESDVTSTMASLMDRVTGLEDRLSDIVIAQEDEAEGDMAQEQLAAFQSELEQLTTDATAQVEEAKARASAFEAEAAAAEAKAARTNAIASLTSAVEGGAAFQDELAFFDDPPKALTALAEVGVPTLGTLQRDFPDMARSALSVVTVVPQDASAGDRLTAFLKRQTNARSLAPKEGDGTDAVLSRAEASVGAGDLVKSLEELSSLPTEAKDVLGPWMANAQARLDALSALSEISAAE